MAKEYTKEELWGLYEKLPPELREAVFSEETADRIFSVCERNNVNEVSKVAYYVGLALMGVLLPKDFQKTLEKEVGLKKTAAQEVSHQISRFIFYPVKLQLEQLHKVPGEKGGEKVVMPTPRHSERLERKRPTEESPLEEDLAPSETLGEEEPKGAKDQDPYRERRDCGETSREHDMESGLVGKRASCHIDRIESLDMVRLPAPPFGRGGMDHCWGCGHNLVIQKVNHGSNGGARIDWNRSFDLVRPHLPPCDRGSNRRHRGWCPSLVGEKILRRHWC